MLVLEQGLPGRNAVAAIAAGCGGTLLADVRLRSTSLRVGR